MRKKVLNIFILIVTLFLINFDGVRAADVVAMKCEYSDEDENQVVKNMATLTITYKENPTYYDRTSKIIKITKYNNKKLMKSNSEKDENPISANRAIVTNECPEKLAIYKSGGYKTFSGTDEEVANWAAKQGTDKVKILYVKNVSDRIKNMQSMQKTHELVEFDSSVKMYVCKYNKDKESLNFNGTYIQELDISGYVYNNNGCPNSIYKVSHGDNVGYVLNLATFPKICDEDGVKCVKYTADEAVSEEKDKKEQQEKNINYVYTYRNGFGVSETNNLLYLNINVKKANGIYSYVTDNYISKEGKKYNVYLADQNSSGNVDQYIQDIAFNGVEKHNSLSCSLLNKLSEPYYIGLGQNVTDADNAYICYVNNYNSKYDTYAYSIKTDSNLGEQLSAGAKDINSVFDNCQKKGFNDAGCIINDSGFYNKLKNAFEDCKLLYADFNVKNDDPSILECDELNDNFSKYASYFEDDLNITGGNDCTETLGSLGEWLTRIYKILLLAVPVIIMVFGFKDFMKAILNGKEDELKKAGSTFIKRLIFGAVFVALPIFIKVILSLALGGSFSDICIL